MELSNKVKIASFYLKNFMLNPSYINESLLDTLNGFFSFFFTQQNHLHFYHYVGWDEDLIVDTIRDEYDWEVAGDTSTTWRIGDATAAFYNYIYYTIAGFSENDGFRSNQIRVGQISREEALEIVEDNNQPRWESIHEYCTAIGVDFNEVLSAIDSAPRRFATAM